MLWIDKYNGYLADVPNIEFVRCDGTVYSYDEISTASMTANQNNITITGGQGNFPLAYIDTDASLEFTFESAQFDVDIFELANAATITDGDYGTVESARYDVTTGYKVTLPFEVKEGSVYIRGLEEASDASTGKFKVAITAAGASTAGSAEITLDSADASVGDQVRVAYKRRIVNGGMVNVKTTSTTAKGELYVHWPIMSAGDNCADAAVKGILHLHIYRVRVTALPGFNSSYKSAQTAGLTFAAMDPKRADKKLYNLIYEPLDADGNIVTKSSAAKVDWD